MALGLLIELTLNRSRIISLISVSTLQFHLVGAGSKLVHKLF